MRIFAVLLFLAVSAFALSESELDSIGRRVWKNECGGTVEGLTSWNSGEAFASLGIGHFIWYPRGTTGPFEESFPKLVVFFERNGRSVPTWMKDGCPWRNRADFMSERLGGQKKELREMLASTVRLQSQFLAQRMRDSLPKKFPDDLRASEGRIRRNFARLAATGAGTFALIDYVNFKGEGLKLTERYKGQGWGLMQALAEMDENGPATAAFAQAARNVLDRRVRNSPPERGEARWLPGWRNRVRAYAG